MNERIKEIRKYYSLSQEKFGEKLGVTKAAISRMELGTYNVTDTMLKLICSEYNVNPEWLKTGIGEMIVESDTFSFEEYIKNKDLTELEIDIIKAYLSLDSDVRQSLMNQLKAIFTKSSSTGDNVLEKKQNQMTENQTEELDEEAQRELELYKRELLDEKKGKTSSVSENQKEKLA